MQSQRQILQSRIANGIASESELEMYRSQARWAWLVESGLARGIILGSALMLVFCFVFVSFVYCCLISIGHDGSLLEYLLSVISVWVISSLLLQIHLLTRE